MGWELGPDMSTAEAPVDSPSKPRRLTPVTVAPPADLRALAEFA